ncbi:MAG: ABC transporter permease [Planctomycetaceae bacterium]
MIGTIIRIGWLRLRSNPLDLVLTFVVPIIFFSIFAMIFGKGIGSGQTAAVKVLFVDEDQSVISKQLMKELGEDTGLRDVSTDDALAPDRIATDEALTRELATAAVRDGKAKVAIVISTGFHEALWFGDGEPKIELLADSSDQIAAQLAEATVRRAVGKQVGEIEREKAKRKMKLLSEKARERIGDFGAISQGDPVGDAIVVEDVMASGKVNPRISMYAAGIAVLFILFSATSAGATLLEEKESGTLERLLSSQLSITQLLTGKWLWIAGIGFVQLVLMFLWAQLIFGVAFLSHIPGFTVMAIPTVAAAASLAILLATVCKSRNQLNGVALIVVLTMSALGGSMVPRYIMSEELQQIGFITFNAWALEGFEKVFWRDAPLSALWLEVTVLTTASLIMLLAAQVLANKRSA